MGVPSARLAADLHLPRPGAPEIRLELGVVIGTGKTSSIVVIDRPGQVPFHARGLGVTDILNNGQVGDGEIEKAKLEIIPVQHVDRTIESQLPPPAGFSSRTRSWYKIGSVLGNTFHPARFTPPARNPSDQVT